MKENNELIAEFMGIKLHDGMAVFDPTFNEPPEELQYHTSWDWLMPVVVKCHQVGDTKEKEFNEDKDLDDPKGWRAWSYRRVTLSTDIERVYQNVISFIDWYNTTKQQEQTQSTEPQNESIG